MTQILAVLGGGAIVIGGIIAGAWWAFQTWGTKWLQTRFDRQLQDLRHAQSQEMESLRYRISRMLDRTTKLHQKEFEVVPEAWRLLVDAYYHVSAHVSSVKESPGVQWMSDEQLEEFLAGTEFYESQKQQMREARGADRGQVYYKLAFLHDHPRALEVARTFNRYLETYGIFISNKTQFKEIGDLIWSALGEYRDMRELEIREKDAQRKLQVDGKRLLDELEAEIHRRFWRTEIGSSEEGGSTAIAELR